MMNDAEVRDRIHATIALMRVELRAPECPHLSRLMASLAFLDAVGAYYVGIRAEKRSFKEFTRQYLKFPDNAPEYPDILYDGVRSALFHNFNVRGLARNLHSPDITLADQEAAHLQRASNGTILVVPSCFALDVDAAFASYEIDLDRPNRRDLIEKARAVLVVERPLMVQTDPYNPTISVTGVFPRPIASPFWPKSSGV